MNVTAIADPAAELPAEAPRLALLRRILLGRSSTIVATVIVVVFGVIAVFAPLIAPYDPLAQSILSINALPSSEHWLGTDKLGRDVVSRLIYGSRNSLIYGLVAPTLAAFLGTLLGVGAGYFGGIIDRVVTRIIDLLLAFPELLLAIVGEQFDVGNEICGAKLSIRFSEDIISLWNRNADNNDANGKIHDQMRRSMGLPQVPLNSIFC